MGIGKLRYMICRIFFMIRRSGLFPTLTKLFGQLWDRIRWICVRPYWRKRAENGLVVRKVNDYQMYLDLDDIGLSRELLFNGTREEMETRLARDVLKPGMTVLDIGANLGYYALLEASLVGENGFVYAIEPIPRNYEILTKNVDLNRYKNCRTYCMGVSSKNGTEKMYVSNASNWHSMPSGEEEDQSEIRKQWLKGRVDRVIDVPITTVDAFVAEQGIGKVDFIRMDIEGHELEAIPGMEETLKKMPAPLYVFFELHAMLFENPEDKLFPTVCKMLDWGFRPHTVVAREKVLDVDKTNFAPTLSTCKDIALVVLMEKE